MVNLQQEVVRLDNLTDVGIRRENTKMQRELAKAYQNYAMYGNGACQYWERIVYMQVNYFVSAVQTTAHANQLRKRYNMCDESNIADLILNARKATVPLTQKQEIDAMTKVIKDFYNYKVAVHVLNQRGVDI